MRSPAFVSIVTVVSIVAAGPRTAVAQPSDLIGIRARGMGGAFTAVANDATASWWNPAGLAGGAYLDMIVEYGRARDNGPEHRALAIGFPALGFSYYRVPAVVSGPTGASSGGRLDLGTVEDRLLDLSQFGATIGQSLGNHLVIASTLKLIRAAGESQGGLDVGAMAAYRSLRLGLMVRNARESTLETAAGPLELKRQFRAGASWSTTPHSNTPVLVVAVDADLRPVLAVSGEERRVAFGGEVWTPRRHIGVRAGLARSHVGASRGTRSAGVSLALRPGTYAEAEVTGGDDFSRRGWGAGLRMTF